MEFNYSLDVTPRIAVNLNAPLFASVSGVAADLGGGECVFRDSHGENHVMTLQVLQAMNGCRRFRTLDEHTQAIRQALPDIPAPAIGRVLENLLSRQLLKSEQDFVASLRASAPLNSLQDEPMAIVIFAHDRPQRLRALLDSFLAQKADWRQHAQEILLIDDSQQRENQRQNAGLLENFGVDLGLSSHYLSRENFAEKIKKMPLAESKLRTAVEALTLPENRNGNESTLGANLNRAVLLAAGKRMVLLNEDSVLPLCMHPYFERGMDWNANQNLPARFYETREQALSASGNLMDAPIEESPVALHQTACGATIGALLKENAFTAWKPGDLRDMEMSRLLLQNTNSRIVATMTGQRGDCSNPESNWLFLLDKASRDSLIADRHRYLRTLEQPALWHGVARATPIAQIKSLPFTLDAREWLPFAPAYGNDGLNTFGGLLRLTRPESLSMHLPTSLGYTGDADRSRQKPGAQPETPRFNHFLADYLESRTLDVRAEMPSDRLRWAAAMVRDLAAASEHNLVGFMGEYLQFVRSDLIGKLQLTAQNAGVDAPIYWQADLREIVSRNGRALIERGLPKLAAMENANTAQAIAAELRSSLNASAEAMEAWPVIWDVFHSSAISPARIR